MGFEWIANKNYKRHYICLSCQKGFKRSSEADMKHPPSSDLSNLMEEFYNVHLEEDIINFINNSFQKIQVTCPQCTKYMVQVSYDFEVPKQKDSKAWKTVEERFMDKTNPNYSVFINWHELQLKRCFSK